MRLRHLLPVLLLACISCYGQGRSFYSISGKVIDPYTSKGIPLVYIAFQGIHAAGAMGGTEYFEDLVLDSTDRDGNFSIHVPAALVDSFIEKEGGVFNVYRFALNCRSVRSKRWWAIFEDYNLFSRFLPVDSIVFNDRNYLNNRTYVLTGKNQRFKSDITGMSIPFTRGSGLLIVPPPNDTSYNTNARLAVQIQEIPAGNKQVSRQDELLVDEKGLEKAMLVKPNTPLNVILRKYYLQTQQYDTLMVLRNIQLGPGEIRKIKVD